MSWHTSTDLGWGGMIVLDGERVGETPEDCCGNDRA